MKNLAQALRSLYQQERRPEAAQRPAGLVPPPLAPLRASADARGVFPVCLVEDEDRLSVVSLADLVDEALERLALRGDEAERCRKVVRQLEREMAVLADQGAQEALSGLWGAAATTLIANPDVPEAGREVIRKDVSRVREQIETDGLVIPFHPSVPLRLLRRAADRYKKAQAAGLRDEVKALKVRLTELLNGETNGQPLTPEREERLAAAAESLAAHLEGNEQAGRDDAVFAAPDGAAARARVQAEAQRRLAFFRALQTARLEVDNAYDEDRHDAHFAHFNLANLTAAERTFFPPMLLHLDTASLTGTDFDRILDLLDTDAPLKILVTVDQLQDAADGSSASARLSGWRTHLAERAVGAGAAFVLQATAAQAPLLMDGFNDGLRYEGPALFCVYTGAGTASTSLPPYASAVAALSSRVFPSFLYDPSKGDDWASRFHLLENPQPERRWPELEAPAPEGAEPRTGPFTPVDFFACDARLDDRFMTVPAGTGLDGLDGLAPLATYLAAAPDERADQVPYIVLVDEDGKERQVVCAGSMLRTAAQVATRWKHLQERGGIDNSHAARAVAAERARLTRAFEEEKKELAQRHEQEIDQVTEALAQKLVSNIAAGLLNLSDTDVDLAAPPVAAPRAAAPPAEAPEKAAAPEPAPAAEAEDDALSFDEPYIETPECTSCDECININAALFAYNDEEKAYIKDPRGGPYRDLVTAAENCPARIIHPGKPLNPDEPGLDELIKRAEPYL